MFFFSGKCHISVIDIVKLLFKNPGQDKLLKKRAFYGHQKFV